MNETKGASLSSIVLGALAVLGCGATEHPSKRANEVGDAIDVQLVRSATVLLHYKRDEHKTLHILVDPILADPGTEAPIAYSNGIKIPMIELPIDKNALIEGIDAVLLTHYHPDHFDREAEKILPKNTLIFCQPYDESALREKGFTNLRVVNNALRWEGLTISRFSASHYQGATGKPPFGESSSYFLQTKNEALFLTGDAILDDRLKARLIESQPKKIVANTGECQFSKDNPVLRPGVTMTLTADELQAIARMLPQAQVAAVHMDAINHCPLTKRALEDYVERENLTGRILVLHEGELANFATRGRHSWRRPRVVR